MSQKIEGFNRAEAEAVIANAAKAQWGWEWENPDHVKTLSDVQLANTAVTLLRVIRGYNMVYTDMITKVSKAIEWKEDMGK